MGFFTAVTAIAALAGTAAGIAGAQDQKRSARIAADRQKEEMDRQKKALQEQEDMRLSNEKRNKQKAAQKINQLNAGGRTSTLLSGPLGQAGTAAPAGGKGLLGV